MNGCRRGGFERRAPLSGVRLKSQKARNVMTFAPFFVYRFPRKCFASLFTFPFCSKGASSAASFCSVRQNQARFGKAHTLSPACERPPFPFFKKAVRSRSGAEVAPLGVLNTAKAAQPPHSSDSMDAAWLMPRRATLFRPISPEGRLAARRSRIPCSRKKAQYAKRIFAPAQTRKGRGVVRSAARP